MPALRGRIPEWRGKGFDVKKTMVVLLLSLALLSAAGLQSVTAQRAAMTYKIDLDSNGGSAAGATAAPAFAESGVKGWTLSMLSGAGVDCYIYKAAAGQPLAIHKSDVEWLAYVIEGNGQLILADADGKQTGVVNFKKGDYMIFQANTMHGWKGGTVDSQMLFVTLTKK